MAFKGALLTLAAGIFTLVTGSALADTDSGNFNMFLKGKYRESGSIDCATGPTSVEIGSGSPIHISFTGVVTYAGNGQATTTSERGVIIGSGGQPSAFENDCFWTYSVNRNGSFSREGTCSAPGFTLSGLKWKGQIGEEGTVLSLSMSELAEQTLVITGGSTIKRICGGVSTEVRVQRP